MNAIGCGLGQYWGISDTSVESSSDTSLMVWNYTLQATLNYNKELNGVQNSIELMLVYRSSVNS